MFGKYPLSSSSLASKDRIFSFDLLTKVLYVNMEILATNTATVVVFQKAIAVVAVYSEGNPVTTVVRGSTVTFKVNFTNDLGAPINPSQASVFVSYPNPLGTRTLTEIGLTQSGNDWTASWDSGV